MKLQKSTKFCWGIRSFQTERKPTGTTTKYKQHRPDPPQLNGGRWTYLIAVTRLDMAS